MNKYTKLLRDDAEIKAAVIAILEELSGQNYDDVAKIMACVKYFVGEISKFNEFKFKADIVEFATGGEGNEQ